MKSNEGLMMNYILLNLMTLKVYTSNSKEDATNLAIALNKQDDNHPTFNLYFVPETGYPNTVYVGRLTRKFGSNEFFWDGSLKEGKYDLH
jgi:hypothetical protein